MELFLNLAWVALAGLLCGLWYRDAQRRGQSRGLQLVALAMLVLILFPVISVTDDLQAAQNPAEDDVYLRLDSVYAGLHSAAPPAAAPPQPVFQGLALAFAGQVVGNRLAAPASDRPALGSIQNRPPPVA